MVGILRALEPWLGRELATESLVTPKSAAPRATVYSHPRQGPDRELKKAIEGYWKGRVSAHALHQAAADLRRATWQRLTADGINEVPTGDFSYYDHMLDTSVMVGAIPERHRTAVETDGPGRLLRDGARQPGGRAAGDDQVVRHQLPLVH